MIYAVEMGSGAMIYIPSFIKIILGIQKLIGEIHRHRQHGDLISQLRFFLNKESRLQMKRVVDRINDSVAVHYASRYDLRTLLHVLVLQEERYVRRRWDH
jgi:hypothetical protein